METLVESEPLVSDNMELFIEKFFAGIPGIENAGPVPIVDAASLTAEEFRNEWVFKNKPCLIKGAIMHWPAVAKWKNKDYWLQTCEKIDVDIYPHGNFLNQERHDQGKQVVGFQQAIDRLFDGNDYIFNIAPKEVTASNGFSGIIKDLPGFKFLPEPAMPRTYERRRFFLYRRSATSWHYHHTDETLMCQVGGKKRVVLLPAGIPRAAYVRNFLDNEMHLEGFELDRSLDLRPVVVDVDEGDSLYIPPYWFHGVTPITGEIGSTLAFCWRSPWHIMGDLSNYFVRRLYRNAFWPLNRFSLFVPFVGLYAVMCHYWRQIVKSSGRS